MCNGGWSKCPMVSVALEDLEVVLSYLEEKEYSSAKLYLENIIKEGVEK